MNSVRQEKKTLRDAMLRRRPAMARRSKTAPNRLAERFMATVPLAARAVVSGYLAMNSEIDVMPLLRRLRLAGHDIALPVVVGRGVPLLFRHWREGDVLKDGPLGTRHPGCAAAKLQPDLLLVPLLAFDRPGYRLGYGGGYYDRTLSALRRSRSVVAVGVAFAEQEVPSVPHGVQDEALDWVVTESEAFQPEAGG